MRAILWCLAYLASGALGAILFANEAASSIRLTENGSTAYSIYLHEDASSELLAATQDLSSIIAEISGAKIAIQMDALGKQGKGIHIKPETGNTPESSQDIEAFQIKIDSTGIYLRGKTDLALIHAIYTFLQEFGGCRWYTPGKEGAFIPSKSTWDLPQINKQYAPDFLSREFFGLHTEEERLWAKRNRLNKRFEYHHNLYTIFNEEVFVQHSEWFPLIQGMRIPPTNNERSAQPNFSNAEAADYAAYVAAQYFENNPQALSFSLGMNDGLLIDSSSATRSIIEPLHFYREIPDYSDLIFRFMNRAAQTLGKSFPQKYLGCLAYHYALNTPSFSVEPKVIPYITLDTSQWYDENLKNKDQDLLLRWTKSGPEFIGLYDYYEGLPFVIPRIFTRYIHESLLFAYKAGVRGFTAELYPIWPLDGPKAWITAQLLWDTQLNRQTLLDEFYENYFQKSAKPMGSFYALCEEAWIHQEKPGWWLKFYKNLEQTSIFKPNLLNTLIDLLQLALQKAESLSITQKIHRVIEAFMPTLLLKNLNLATEELEWLDPEENIYTTIEYIQNYYAAFKQVENTLTNNQSWKYLTQSNPIPSTLEKLKKNPELNKLDKLLKTSGNEEDLMALKLLTSPERKPRENALSNPTLTPIDPYGLEISSWHQSSWLSPEASIQDIGGQGILIKGQKQLSITQSLDAKPGLWYIFELSAEGKQNPAGTVRIFIQWKNEDGSIIKKSSHATLPQKQPGMYQLVTLSQAPEYTTSADFIIQVSNQTKEDWLKISNAFVSSTNPIPER